MKWFENVTTIEELRKQYRALLKKYHPDNPDGNAETCKEINTEYDIIFADLQRSMNESGESPSEQESAANEAFKSIMEQIAHINADVEIIGEWVWVHGGYEYRELLKSIGFRFAPKKKAWTWHDGAYRKYHKCEVSLDEIRSKYGSKTQIQTTRIELGNGGFIHE